MLNNSLDNLIFFLKGRALLIKVSSITLLMLFTMVKVAFSQMTALNAEISSLIRPNWEFESFWAIPRVGDTKPTVVISFFSGENTVNVRCLDLEYLEIKKTFKPKAKL